MKADFVIAARKTPDLDGPMTATVGDNPQFRAEKTPSRVLVVDDETLIRWSVSETLTAHGMIVSQAENAASAIRRLTEQGPFDVVVLDFRLPDNDDLTLLTRVRSLAPDAVVIMMTAYGTPEITDGALRLGAQAVIGKPFELRDIAHLVETLVTGRFH